MSQGVARAAALRQGITLEGVTVGYNTLEGLVAIAAGIAAGSVALTGFGMDSVIEVTSGALLWWRLRAELGLGSNALLGWWWADPVAALAMLPLIVREGLGTWRGEAGESEDA
jgi:divalent metal cation (Fe/Co/Zn/Cd) transporter